MTELSKEDMERSNIIASSAANFAGYKGAARMRGSFIGYVYHLIYTSLTEVRAESEKEIDRLKAENERLKKQLTDCFRYKKMFGRIKSICVGDGTFLTGAHVLEIEKQDGGEK